MESFLLERNIVTGHRGDEFVGSKVANMYR